MVFIDIMAEN